METSIRLYHTNNSIRSSFEDEDRREHPFSAPPSETESEQRQERYTGPAQTAYAPDLPTIPTHEHVDGRNEQRATPGNGTNGANGVGDKGKGIETAVDVADFENIFLRYQTPITNYIYHLIGNREQAYDLAQDVFVKAYKALLNGTAVQPGALSAWLYRIAYNTTTDGLRRRRLISWLPLSLFNEDRGIGAGVLSDSGGPSSESFSSPDEGKGGSISALYERNGYDGGRFENRVADREIVERVMKQLQPKYAACLWLYENDGLSCAEIAQVLDISASAVKMRLMRARERFIALYKQEVGED
jgi:RNA polymerase sigma-70 factor (ECF subfamily)